MTNEVAQCITLPDGSVVIHETLFDHFSEWARLEKDYREHIELLTGNLSLAEDERDVAKAYILEQNQVIDALKKGLANATQDLCLVTQRCQALAFLMYGSSGPNDPWQAKLDEVTKPLHAEIERLNAREKTLLEVIDSRERGLGFVPLDEPSGCQHDPMLDGCTINLVKGSGWPGAAEMVCKVCSLSTKELIKDSV